jgi:predicted nucleic acid-binding OB-fold protein
MEGIEMLEQNIEISGKERADAISNVAKNMSYEDLKLIGSEALDLAGYEIDENYG